jgi:hemoglobin-like flavoprotein
MGLDLDTLETSFDLIAPRGEELVDVFYARLFEAAPSVRPLFARTDLRKQKAMLLATLVLLRKSLRDLRRSRRSYGSSVPVTSPTVRGRSTTRSSPR